MKSTLLNRFKDYIKKHGLFTKDGKYLLAFSSGVDSVVLSDLLLRSEATFLIAHINFQLRGEDSHLDQEFAESYSKKIGVEFITTCFETDKIAQIRKTGIQETARTLRYEWLNDCLKSKEEASFKSIITAHHADDNIETVWLHLLRGTGLQGLCGMEPKGGGIYGNIIRPLLFASKNEIIDYAKEQNLPWREDVSNQTNDYSRNLLRHEVLPNMLHHFPDSAKSMRENILRFRNTQTLFSNLLNNHLKKVIIHKQGEIHIPVLKLLKTPGYSTLLHYILHPLSFTSAQIQETEALLYAETGKYIKSETHRIIKNRQWLILTPTTGSKNVFSLLEKDNDVIESDSFTIKVEREINTIEISKDPNIATLDSKLLTYPIIVRQWKKGDYFYPLGMNKKKKLSDFFINQKMSLTDKENAIVVESGRRIVWIAGIRLDDRFRITDNTTSVIRLTFTKKGRSL